MTASAGHIKALARAHAAGDESSFYSVALQMAASAARHGQNRFAEDLRNLIDAAKAERIPGLPRRRSCSRAASSPTW